MCESLTPLSSSLYWILPLGTSGENEVMVHGYERESKSAGVPVAVWSNKVRVGGFNILYSLYRN